MNRLESQPSSRRTLPVSAAPHPRPSRPALSDEELQRHVQVRLSQFGPRISRSVRARVRRGEVTLSGAVGSDYERRLIQQKVERVSGIDRIVNLIDIQGDEPAIVAESEPELERPSAFPRIARRTLAGLALAGVLCLAWSFAPRSTGPAIVPVAGTLRVAGQPAAGALLVLHPLSHVSADSPKPLGRVDTAGNIEWTTREPGDGVPVGEYAATVVWHRTVEADGDVRPGPNVLASRYSRAELTPLRVRVDDQDGCRIALDLSR